MNLTILQDRVRHFALLTQPAIAKAKQTVAARAEFHRPRPKYNAEGQRELDAQWQERTLPLRNAVNESSVLVGQAIETAKRITTGNKAVEKALDKPAETFALMQLFGTFSPVQQQAALPMLKDATAAAALRLVAGRSEDMEHVDAIFSGTAALMGDDSHAVHAAVSAILDQHDELVRLAAQAEYGDDIMPDARRMLDAANARFALLQGLKAPPKPTRPAQPGDENLEPRELLRLSNEAWTPAPPAADDGEDA